MYNVSGIMIPVKSGVLMREQVHTSLTAFRINAALLAAASEKARRNGVSLSELLRHAVRKEVREAA